MCVVAGRRELGVASVTSKSDPEGGEESTTQFLDHSSTGHNCKIIKTERRLETGDLVKVDNHIKGFLLVRQEATGVLSRAT